MTRARHAGQRSILAAVPHGSHCGDSVGPAPVTSPLGHPFSSLPTMATWRWPQAIDGMRGIGRHCICRTQGPRRTRIPDLAAEVKVSGYVSPLAHFSPNALSPCLFISVLNSIWLPTSLPTYLRCLADAPLLYNVSIPCMQLFPDICFHVLSDDRRSSLSPDYCYCAAKKTAASCVGVISGDFSRP